MLNKTTAAPENRRPWRWYRVGAPEEHLSGSVLLRSSTRVSAPEEPGSVLLRSWLLRSRVGDSQERPSPTYRENSPQPPNGLPTPPEAAKPPPEGTEDRTPKEAQGDHPAKTGNTKPGTAAHREKGHRNKQTHTRKKKRKKKNKKKKKEPATEPERKGMGGQGPQGPGQGQPAKKKKKKAQKTQPDNPAKKGWAQPRPGPSTHAHTARANRKRRGASGAPTQPHTSHKQAKTEPQPRTPQTADTRGTAPKTVPKHTHPRPQPGLAGLTKPTPNRKPDPNTNVAQQ